MGLRFSSRVSGYTISRATEYRRGRVDVSGMGSTWAVNFVLDILSLRYREDKQRKRYQVASWIYMSEGKEKSLER